MAEEGDAKAAVRPSLEDLRRASEEILRELAASAVGGDPSRGERGQTAHLVSVVEARLATEPIATPAGVSEAAVRTAKAVGTTIVALAHLESTGHVLPFGGRWLPATGRYSRELTLMTLDERNPRGYSVADQFNFELAQVYALPQTGLATELESPIVFLSSLPPSMGPKVQRLLREAADSYRSGQMVGTTILLAIASEAALEQLASKLVRAGESSLSKLMSGPTARTAELQRQTIEALARRNTAAKAVLASIDTTANAYRELRNHAVHEPETRFDETLFARSIVANLMVGAIFYFRQLYKIHDSLP
jgi:hypothetical protein